MMILYVVTWMIWAGGVESPEFEVREMEKAEHVNRIGVHAHQKWVKMIGKEVLVRNEGDLLIT